MKNNELILKVANFFRDLDHEIASEPLEETLKGAEDILSDEESMKTLIETLLMEVDELTSQLKEERR